MDSFTSASVIENKSIVSTRVLTSICVNILRYLFYVELNIICFTTFHY